MDLETTQHSAIAEIFKGFSKLNREERLKALLHAGVLESSDLEYLQRGGLKDFALGENEGQWWLLFHAADKDLKPDGSYGGVIPPNTHEYHRNLYAVPVEFFINQQGVPDMRVLD